MVISREVKKEEALKRMKTIVDHFNLGDKLVNYLIEDKIYYSYGYSMDTIKYDERYEKAVLKFEKERNAFVYHVIEAKTQEGLTLLSFLYVSDYKEDWKTELLEGQSIFSYSICIEEPNYDDMGWIVLDSMMGYLRRIA